MSAHLFFIIRPHVGPQRYPWRRPPLPMGAGALLPLLLPLLVALFAPGAVFAGDLTLEQVGAPIPGDGPCGLAVAKTCDRTYAFVGEHFGNQVHSLKIDRTTGLLTLVGSVSRPNGPSALAATRNGRHLLATTLGGNNVTSYSIDPCTGLLTLVGSVSSGGSGPVNLAVDTDDFAVIANRDSDSLGVVRIDPTTGLLTLVGSTTVGRAPNDVKVTGPHVVVGHAISNDVHLLRIDPTTGLLTLVGSTTVGAPVTSVAVHGREVVAGTFDGLVHYYRIRSDQLFPLGAYDTGGDITDIEFGTGRMLFVTGGIPNHVTAFKRKGEELEELGSLSLPGPPTSRNLATAQGRGGTTWVLANEFQGDQTFVIAAQRTDGED